MNVLSIEASGETWSLACVTSGHESEVREAKVRAVLASNEPRSLSRDLVVSIDTVLQQAQWASDDLDLVAVGIGPGSWTSLRIALATAKTLAQVSNCCLCGVSSFAAWASAWTSAWAAAWANSPRANAFEAPEDCSVVVTARCRPGAIYAQIFEIGYSPFEYSNGANIFRAKNKEGVTTIPELADQFANLLADLKNQAPVWICGEARENVTSEFLNRDYNARMAEVSMESVAVAVARLGARKASQNEADNALTLQPLYIGVSNAERAAQKRLITS